MIDFFADGVEMPSGVDEILNPVLTAICNDHGLKIEYINVIFVDDEKLLEINRDFLQHDYFTDIITFNYADNPERNIEGELYVSLDRVHDNALLLGVAGDEELYRVVIHGVLHLCGYKDKEPGTQVEMQLAENKYIRRIVPRGTL